MIIKLKMHKIMAASGMAFIFEQNFKRFNKYF
jgi:hypothetical protein